MSLPYTQSTRYTPPQIPQVRTGTSWDLNAQNPFGQNYQGSMFKGPGPAMGSAFRPPAPTGGFTAGGGLLGPGNMPATGSIYTPSTQYTAGGGLIGPGNTLQTGSTYTSQADLNAAAAAAGAGRSANASSAAAGRQGQLQEQAQAGAMDQASDAASRGAGAPLYPQLPIPGGGSQRPGPMEQFNFNYQDYMNDPGYQFMLDEGMRAVNARASARGLLGSTGTDREAIRYATGLASQYYNDAFNRFDANRNFAANRYDTAFNQDWTQKMFDADMWKYMTDKEFDNFWMSDASYNTKMAAKAARDAGLASVGQDSAGKAVELATNTAAALANLSTSLAMFQAMAAQGKGEASGGLLDAVISGITSLIDNLGSE